MTKLAFFLLLTALLPAQRDRNEWQMKPSVPNSAASSTLADAHLSPRDRAVIYQAIDNGTVKTIHRGNPEAERAEVLSVEVSRMILAQDGSAQILTSGPSFTCGSGGCRACLFVRQNGQLHLALDANVESFFIKKTITNGFHDIATSWHLGADESLYSVYGWTGSHYTKTDCYDAKFTNGRQNAPIITSCSSLQKSPAPPTR